MVALVEGKDPKVIMRKIVKIVLKAMTTQETSKEKAKELLKEEIKKGEMQVLNLLLQLTQQQFQLVLAGVKRSVQSRV